MPTAICGNNSSLDIELAISRYSAVFLGYILVQGLFSAQFSCSVMSDSLWPHGLQHTRLPCPSPTPWGLLGLMSINLVMPSNHLILGHPLLLLPSILPGIRVFYSESVLPIRWPKDWTSASVLPMNIQDWFPLGWTHWISLQSKGLSRVSSNTTVQKHQFFSAQIFL